MVFVNNMLDFKLRIEYDIVVVCICQRVFYYQVFLFYFEDKKFLIKVVERYIWYFMFKRDNLEMFFVFCYDFDFIWYVYQVNLLLYKKDIMEILGKVFKYDDLVNDCQFGLKFNMFEEIICEKWKNLG